MASGEKATEVRGEHPANTEEEADVLRRSRWRGMKVVGINKDEEPGTEHRFASYKDSVMKDLRPTWSFFDGSQNDGEVSDDDVLEEEDDETCFSIGMTKEQKIMARRPWLNCLIVKLVGRSIGYHYLLRRVQTMWRTQDDPLLIDLGFDFYVVKLGRRRSMSGHLRKVLE